MSPFFRHHFAKKIQLENACQGEKNYALAT
jgi:hypothetical protein